jgi:hypothetical protein
MHSGIGSWPGISVPVKPPNSTLKLYGGAAFERAMHEFRCATYSIECPQVSREKVQLSLQLCRYKILRKLAEILILMSLGCKHIACPCWKRWEQWGD